MGRKSEIIAGLDIGTTKIACIIGEVSEEGIDIIGIGSHPSRGLRKGVVINIDATINSIQKAVEEAELMAGCEVNTVYAGIAGGHIQGFNSHGIVAVNKEKEVRTGDLARVVDAARAVAIPMDQWFRLEVTIAGETMTALLDGKPGLHFTAPQPIVGFIGLWSKGDTTAYYRNLKKIEFQGEAGR